MNLDSPPHEVGQALANLSPHGEGRLNLLFPLLRERARVRAKDSCRRSIVQDPFSSSYLQVWNKRVENSPSVLPNDLILQDTIETLRRLNSHSWDRGFNKADELSNPRSFVIWGVFRLRENAKLADAD